MLPLAAALRRALTEYPDAYALYSTRDPLAWIGVTEEQTAELLEQDDAEGPEERDKINREWAHKGQRSDFLIYTRRFAEKVANEP
jgi:hypothetical protein